MQAHVGRFRKYPIIFHTLLTESEIARNATKFSNNSSVLSVGFFFESCAPLQLCCGVLCAAVWVFNQEGNMIGLSFEIDNKKSRTRFLWNTGR